MQYSSSSPFQLTLSLLCIHLLCRQNIFMTMSCSREYFIRDQERRKQVYTVDKENFESNWKNFLCLSFLSCPPFKFQRQKKKRIKAKNDIQLNCLKQLHIMHTQRQKPQVLESRCTWKKAKAMLPRKLPRMATIWLFSCQCLSLWSPKKVVRAHVTGEYSIYMH